MTRISQFRSFRLKIIMILHDDDNDDDNSWLFTSETGSKVWRRQSFTALHSNWGGEADTFSGEESKGWNTPSCPNVMQINPTFKKIVKQHQNPSFLSEIGLNRTKCRTWQLVTVSPVWGNVKLAKNGVWSSFEVLFLGWSEFYDNWCWGRCESCSPLPLTTWLS